VDLLTGESGTGKEVRLQSRVLHLCYNNCFPMDSGSRGPFLKHIESFRLAAERIREGDVKALHETRVATRRLRELVPLLGLDDRTTQDLKRRLKKLTKHLGIVRELDVLLIGIQNLRGNSRYSSSALGRVAVAVARDRNAADTRLGAKLPYARLERLARRLERAATDSGKDQPDRASVRSGELSASYLAALDARIVKRATRARVAIEVAGTPYFPERLHDVRITLKKLRYAAEPRAGARRDRTAGDLMVLKGAQDLLGRLHDLEVLIGRIRHLQASLETPDLVAWRQFASLVHILEDDCRLLHGQYIRGRGALIAVVDRLRRASTDAAGADRRAAG